MIPVVGIAKKNECCLYLEDQTHEIDSKNAALSIIKKFCFIHKVL
jgi:hypothetical protein